MENFMEKEIEVFIDRVSEIEWERKENRPKTANEIAASHRVEVAIDTDISEVNGEPF